MRLSISLKGPPAVQYRQTALRVTTLKLFPMARDKVSFQIFTGGEHGARKLCLGARRETKRIVRQALTSGIAGVRATLQSALF